MEFEDIIYEKKDGIAKITFNRPDVLNAFRVKTLEETVSALEDSGADPTIGVVVLTGAGTRSFCVGGDSKETGGQAGYPRGVLEGTGKIHQLIRGIPKPVIAMVNGYALGGGHVFQVVCDLTIASETARFGQAGPKVGSFDAGFGSAYLARVVGEKKAREIWYLCRQYSAQEAMEMGLVNKVVPPDKLEEEVMAWCREILEKSPTAIKVLKASFNADSDSMAGLEAMSWETLWLYYQTEEAMEGRKSFLEKRPPDFMKFRK